MGTFLEVLDDALILLGLAVMTIGVYGVVRFPDVYVRAHAASKAVFLGVISLLAATCLTGEPAVIFRAALISAFLILTTPVATHVIAQSAFHKNRRMQTPGAIDESGRDLTTQDEGG